MSGANLCRQRGEGVGDSLQRTPALGGLRFRTGGPVGGSIAVVSHKDPEGEQRGSIRYRCGMSAACDGTFWMASSDGGNGPRRTPCTAGARGVKFVPDVVLVVMLDQPPPRRSARERESGTQWEGDGEERAPRLSKCISSCGSTSHPIFDCRHVLKNVVNEIPTPQTPILGAKVLSKCISGCRGTSHPIFDCPHTLKMNFSRCQ